MNVGRLLEPREEDSVSNETVRDVYEENGRIVKREKDPETYLSQNKVALVAYALSRREGRKITPDLVFATKDLEYTVWEPVNPLKPSVDRGNPWDRDRVRSQFEGVLPEGWVDGDEQTEYGSDGKRVVVMDCGKLRRMDSEMHHPAEMPEYSEVELDGYELLVPNV